ncbi:MAG: hypothetical protein AAGC85_25855, partial [Bacteroidota bacterium]
MTLGELSKLIIRGYEGPDEASQQGDPTAEYTAMFNPESFTVNTLFNYDGSQAHSETGAEFKFQGIAPREFSFEFVIDATGATGRAKDIEEEITAFKGATGFKEIQGFRGKERRPSYLSVSWGTFSIRCILKHMDIKYTLFRPDGRPIRAMLCVTFAEYKTNAQKSRENPFSIRSLTQIRDIFDGEKVTDLAKNVYGNAKLFVQVAASNNLNSLRELGVGSRLQFPPVNQLASSLENQVSSFVDQGQKTVQQTLEIAQGKKKEFLQSVSQLEKEAQMQAEGLLNETTTAAGQVQSSIEGQARSLLNQGQGLVNEAQTQATQLRNDLTSSTESALRELQQIQRLGQDSLGDVRNELDSLSREAQSTTRDF